jgi:hypothetical protein
MAFNLFGPPSLKDIRVGYIDPILGYVSQININEANQYERKYPKTTFIFRDGNNVIRYLDINEVNRLTPNDLLSTDNCEGLNQKKECGPPTVNFFGGGGIGAAGNPIIGRDGAFLAVDIVSGGNGYKNPPQVEIKDDCNYGTGATLTSVLGEQKGIVSEVIVNDPGNGYLQPIPDNLRYPVLLRLKRVIVENPGINYNITDKIKITPSNGAILEPVFGPFGKIVEVKVINPGLGFTEYPTITVVPADVVPGSSRVTSSTTPFTPVETVTSSGEPSSPSTEVPDFSSTIRNQTTPGFLTGVNALFRPVFEVVRDPIFVEIEEEKLIQVVDLVGLKQNGYIQGRAYFGSVYYENGIKFAGIYETIGEPIRVYDTLKESISQQASSIPSAIPRSGTDIGSNNPRINIPRTPNDLI